jgi:hypothetical protein
MVECYLARALSSPAPYFGEVEALLIEAWRRGNQDVGRTAMRSILPLLAALQQAREFAKSIEAIRREEGS